MLVIGKDLALVMDIPDEAEDDHEDDNSTSSDLVDRTEVSRRKRVLRFCDVVPVVRNKTLAVSGDKFLCCCCKAE